KVLHETEVRVRERFTGFLGYCRFHVGQRTIQVLQAGKCISTKDMCLSALGVRVENLLCPDPRIVETATGEQETSNLDLQRGVIWQKVGGANELANGVSA